LNNRDYNSLVKTYQEKIQRELDAGIIHPNKDGYIKKSVILSRNIHLGNTRRIQAEGRTAAQCAEKLAQKHRNVIEGAEENFKPKTFGEVANEWFEVEIASSGTSKGNKANYNTLLKLHILPVLKNQDITQLKKKDFQIFLNKFAGQGESNVKKLRMTLMQIIDYAMENEYMPEKRIKLNLPEMKPIEKREILSEDLITLLIKAQKEYPPAWVFVAMVATGLRPCEIYHIKYTDIDFEKKLLYVKKSKTDNGIRVLPIPQYVLDLILEDKRKLNEKGIHPEYVFHQSTNPMAAHTSTTINGNWNTTLRTMDILNGAKVYRNKVVESTIPYKDKLTPYNLRHTYCTMLNDCNISEYFKKRLMGHTLSDSITDSVYTHSSEEKIIRAAKPFLTHIQKLFAQALK
jgi:integrase